MVALDKAVDLPPGAPASQVWMAIQGHIIADGSLVAAAENLSVTRVFTLDSHFYNYRINGTESFDVVP